MVEANAVTLSVILPLVVFLCFFFDNKNSAQAEVIQFSVEKAITIDNNVNQISNNVEGDFHTIRKRSSAHQCPNADLSSDATNFVASVSSSSSSTYYYYYK